MTTPSVAPVPAALRGLADGRQRRRRSAFAGLPDFLLGGIGLARADLERDELARSLGW